MFRVAAELARNALGLIYPPACLICDALVSAPGTVRHGLCIECYSAVTADVFASCPWCAQTVGQYTETTNGCTDCRGVSLGFECAVRLGQYAGKLRDAVLRMKFLPGEGLADMMGRILSESRDGPLRERLIETVAPIPLHWWRKCRRGYNQSESVARELAAGLDATFEPRLLRRVRWTTQQTQPTRAARQENVKGVFRVARGARIVGSTVLLVDDVMTTGSTASEAAKALLNAGAGRVVVAVLARR